MDKDKLKKIANEELTILNGVIDYAEKMISDNRWVTDCSILRRRAYAKTVVIETEKKGRCVYRLTTASITDKLSSGCATPYSPIGRLCSVANVGLDGESVTLGEYDVSETRLFDRFDGVDYLNNIRNFLRMKISTVNHADEIVDDLKKVVVSQKVASLAIPKIAKTPVAKETQLEPPKIETPIFIVEDDDLEISLEYEDDEDSSHDEQDDGYFGLNEVFYVNQTIQQNKIIARSPFGAMYVEGVAGSGKTSAALGRTKMLCGFNAENVFEKAQFENILGEDFGDYWEGKYADKFSQEGSIGFVRTAELISYLEETCRRIDLPNLRIREYKELQNALKSCYKIVASQLGGNWKGGITRDSHCETAMRWLFSADQNIANFLSKNLHLDFPSVESINNHFVKDDNSRIPNVVKKAFEHFEIEFSRIEKELSTSNNNQRFLLDGLAEKINQAIKLTNKEILGRDTLWFFYKEFTFCANSIREIASLLVKNNVPLLNRTGSKLEFSDVDDLYLKLLPESNNKPHLLYGENTLRPIRLEQLEGYGSRNFPERWRTDKIQNRILVASELVKLKLVQHAVRQISIKSIFVKSLEKMLLNKLNHVGDIYYSTLNQSVTDYPDFDLATKILAQLETKRIANQDIDLLLCLSHLIFRNFSGSRVKPDIYQSVFIDEVQDFTEQQIYLMAEQADPQYKAVTIVGDIAQKLHNGDSIDIQACFPSGKIPFIQLTDNLRQLESPALALFSHVFRNHFHSNEVEISSQLLKAIQTVSDPYLPEIYAFKSIKELDAKIIDLVVNSSEHQTLAVIMPSNDFAKKLHDRVKNRLDEHLIDCKLSENVDLSKRFIKHFMSVLNAKGLEFDTVILPYLEGYDLTNQSDINKLYVGLTRAKKRLIILGTKENQLFNDVWSNFEHSFMEYSH